MAGAACSLNFWSFSMAALSLDLASVSASTSVLFRDAIRSRISRSRAAAWSSALAWSAAPAEGVNQPTPMARTTPATNTVAGREHLGIDMAFHPPSRARMGVLRAYGKKEDLTTESLRTQREHGANTRENPR